MLIDFRVRPPYASNLKLAVFANKKNIPTAPDEQLFTTIDRNPIPSADQQSVEVFMDELKKEDTRKAVIMGRVSEVGSSHNQSQTNDEAAELMRRHPDMFLAFAAVEPRNPKALEEIERTTQSLGFKGVCIDPSFSTPPLYADAEEIDPIYRYCEEHHLPVSIMQSGLYVKDLTYTDPIHVQHAAQKYPKLKIIVPHACWPFIKTLAAVAMMHKNVYLLPDCYAYLKGMFDISDFVNTVNHFLKYRVLYASSYPLRSVAQARALWMDLPFTDEALRLTLYENAARLLEL